MIELLLSAMVIVESGGNPNAVGDGGKSIGPLQIQYAYWKDSGVGGEYKQCKDLEYAKRVVRAYWKRYCPKALKQGDLQTLARVHNGGPRGHKIKATRVYWSKVSKNIKHRGV